MAEASVTDLDDAGDYREQAVQPVFGNEDGSTPGLMQRIQGTDNAGGTFEIKLRGWLVAEEEAGVQRERGGNRCALAFTTGESGKAA